MPAKAAGPEAVAEAAYELALDWPHLPAKQEALRAAYAQARAAGTDPFALIEAQAEGYARGGREREAGLAAKRPASEPEQPVSFDGDARVRLQELHDRIAAQIERMREPRQRGLRAIGALESLLLELEAATDDIYGPDHYAFDNALRHIEQFGEYLDDRSVEMREQRRDNWDSAVLETERWVLHNLRRDLAGVPHSDPLAEHEPF